MEFTHPDFKSVVEDVANADDIFDLVGTALEYQYMFERRTSPWEMVEWQEGDLENLTVKVKDIDRVYHIHHYDDGVSGSEFELLARMDYNARKVFVKLTAGCDFTGFECEGGGEIYVSFDAQVFLKSIVNSKCNPLGIWKSMVEDGLVVDEPTEFDFGERWQWNNVPMLKFLCHMTVHSKQDQLQHYDEVLPDQLADSISEFLKIRETKEHYDNGF